MKLIATLFILCSTCLTRVLSECYYQNIMARNEKYVILSKMSTRGSLNVYKYEHTNLILTNTFPPSGMKNFFDVGVGINSVGINKDSFFVAGDYVDPSKRNGTVYAGSIINGTARNVKKLVPSKRPYDHVDMFGITVAINDNKVIAVGAPGDYYNTGAVYIYGYSAGNGWNQTQKITVPKKKGTWFGYVVSITNTHLLVGAPVSIKHLANEIGFVSVFELDPTTNLWNLSDTITPEGYFQNYFGGFLKMDGSRIYVGSQDTDDGKGCVYIYKKNGANWILEEKLVASVRGRWDKFGWDASVYDNAIVVGTTTGKVYLYKYINESWHEINNWHIQNSRPVAVEMYGNNLAMLVADSKEIRMYNLNDQSHVSTVPLVCYLSSSKLLLPYSLFSYFVFIVLYLIF